MKPEERVLEALAEQPLTQGGIAAATKMARRTIYVALQRLMDADMVRSQRDLLDARRTWDRRTDVGARRWRLSDLQAHAPKART